MDPHETTNPPVHKPSYLDASKLISALALLVSLAVGIFTVWSEFQKETATTRQNLTSTLEQIADIDREAAEFFALPLTDEQKEFTSYSFTNRKILLLRQAEELYKKLKEKTTAEDAALIASGYGGVGESDRSESYMKASLKKATKGMFRASALRTLAAFAFLRDDYSEGTRLYDEASNEIGIPRNDMEIAFIMSLDMYKYQYSVMRNDYSSAANHLKNLAIKAQNLACTTGRGQWLQRIYNIVRRFNQYMNIDVSSLARANNKANCLYDPPLPHISNSSKGLEQYLGAYVLNNHRLRVFRWDDNKLAIAVLGQPLYILKSQHQKKGRFGVLGLPDHAVVFHTGSAGDISKLEYIQPSGRYWWIRSM